MSLLIADVREEDFKQALGSFASGVTVVTFWDANDRPCGMTASSFSAVSIDPLLVLVCMNRDARSYHDVMRRRRFGVNILSRSGVDVSSHCARPGEDKILLDQWLHQSSHRHSPPALIDAIAYLDCALQSELPAGTHSIMIGSVERIGMADDHHDDNPLIYYQGRYRDLETTERARA